MAYVRDGTGLKDLPHLARCSSNLVRLSPPRREAALPYTNVLAAVATIKISANATAVNLSPNDISFQVQTRTKQRRLVPRAIREISVFRASVLAKAIASMSIDIEIRNICRAALSCGIIGILPCCRGRSLPRLAHNTTAWPAAGSVQENHANGPRFWRGLQWQLHLQGVAFCILRIGACHGDSAAAAALLREGLLLTAG